MKMKFSKAAELFDSGRKVRRASWEISSYISHPFTYRELSTEDIIATDWEEYEEPKKKVKRWQWVNIDTYYVAGYFYTEEEVLVALGSSIGKLKKLPWTEMEFEE